MKSIDREFVGALGIYTIGGLFWAFLPFFVGLNVSLGGLSQAQAGSLGSAYLLGFSLASMTALWWAGRLDWRRLAVTAAALVIASFLVLARIENYLSSLAIVLAIGVMMGTFWTIAYRVFGGSEDPDRSFSIGIVVSYTVLALVTFIIGNYVVQKYGLAGSSYLLSVVVLMLATLAFLLPQGTKSDDQAAVPGSYRPSLSIALALFAIFATSFAFAGVWAFTERIGADAGFSASQIGPVIASNLLASAAGSVLATVLGTRFGRTLPLLAGMLAMLVSVIALITVDSFVTYAAAVAGLGFCVGLVMPYQMGHLATLDHDNRFVLLIAAAQGIGSAAGPLAGGAAADTGGFRLLIIVTGTALIMAMLAIIFTFGKKDAT